MSTVVLNVLVIEHSHPYWMGQFVDDSGYFAHFERNSDQFPRVAWSDS